MFTAILTQNEGIEYLLFFSLRERILLFHFFKKCSTWSIWLFHFAPFSNYKALHQTIKNIFWRKKKLYDGARCSWHNKKNWQFDEMMDIIILVGSRDFFSMSPSHSNSQYVAFYPESCMLGCKNACEKRRLRFFFVRKKIGLKSVACNIRVYYGHNDIWTHILWTHFQWTKGYIYLFS